MKIFTKSHEIEDIERDFPLLKIIAFDGSTPTSEMEVFEVDINDFESWLLKEDIVPRYIHNIDSQQAAFGDFYENEVPNYNNIKQYMLSDEYEISQMVQTAGRAYTIEATLTGKINPLNLKSA